MQLVRVWVKQALDLDHWLVKTYVKVLYELLFLFFFLHSHGKDSVTLNDFRSVFHNSVCAQITKSVDL